MNAPAIAAPGLDPVDRRIVVATQAGLPLAVRPFEVLAARLDLPVEDVIRRLERLQSTGVIRRVAAVPDHYRLGYRANGMSVWDVDDAHVQALGPRVGALDCVSHCYRRPRRLPEWRYNLFAMVHAPDRTGVAAGVARIAQVLGDAARAHEVIYSTRILKKTGMRIPSR